MAKFSLLLLDAVIVIVLHKLGLWQDIVRTCDVHLARTVVEESLYYTDVNGDRRTIDLGGDEAARLITVHDVPASDLKPLTDNFGIDILEKLDDGEKESLAVLYNSFDEFQLCSSDKIVFRVLGALRRSDQGISLEEILNGIGLTRDLSSQFRKSFREEWSRKGFDEGLRGLSSLK